MTGLDPENVSLHLAGETPARPGTLVREALMDAWLPTADLDDPEGLSMVPIRVGQRIIFARPAMLAFNPDQKRDPNGEWGDGVADNEPSGDGDGHTLGTKFDTPVDTYGMEFSADAAADSRVKDLKVDAEAWKGVPSEDFKMKGAKLIATEEYLRSKPIDKVVSGKEPFREGYDAHLLRTDDGYVVIDGHHRVAMYAALGRATMPAKIIDGRSSALSVRLSPSRPGRMVRLKFDPSQKRDPDGKWTDGGWVKKPGAGKTDADLVKSKPWTKVDRGIGAPGVIYSDEAELNAFRLLESYGKAEPEITSSLAATAEAAKGRMEGLQYRLKGQESLARKIEQKSASKGLTMKEYTDKIGDALRYTMVVPTGRYGEGSQAAIDDFRKQGFEVEVENTWKPGASYKGINTNMKKDGLIFEVQFHTQESLALKMEAHGLYETARDATRSPEERAAATKTMIDNAEAMPTPPGAADVS